MITALNTTGEVRKARPRMAILPVGATEQHSRHLPLATDTLVVETVAVRVAEQLGAYCLPALPYSISHMHRGSSGTVWLRNETLRAVVRDIAVSLRHDGFRELVLLNGHGGNFILVPIVQDLNLDYPDLLVMTLDAWTPVAASGIFEKPDLLMHADEFETSCILHLLEAAVKKGEIEDQTVPPERELLRYFPISKFSKLTHAGSPSRATAEHGQRAMDCMVEHAVKSIRATLKKTAKHRK